MPLSGCAGGEPRKVALSRGGNRDAKNQSQLSCPKRLASLSQVAALPQSSTISESDITKGSCFLHINGIFQASAPTFEVYFSNTTSVGLHLHKLSLPHQAQH